MVAMGHKIVIPAQAGIRKILKPLDPRLREDDIQGSSMNSLVVIPVGEGTRCPCIIKRSKPLDRCRRRKDSQRSSEYFLSVIPAQAGIQCLSPIRSLTHDRF